eukprot:8424248-Pyramimonas_sp.AAC.1
MEIRTPRGGSLGKSGTYCSSLCSLWLGAGPVAGGQGWGTWRAARVPCVLRPLQTGPYQRLLNDSPGQARQRSQSTSAEDICHLA